MDGRASLRLAAIALGVSLGLGSGFLAWLHFLGPNGDLALPASIAPCFAGPASRADGAGAACAAYEHLLLTVPLMLGGAAAAVSAWRARPGSIARSAAFVAAAWLPWAAFHLATRTLDGPGPWVSVGQVAVPCLVVAAVLAAAAGYRPRASLPQA